jgi:hypothetical protein
MSLQGIALRGKERCDTAFGRARIDSDLSVDSSAAAEVNAARQQRSDEAEAKSDKGIKDSAGLPTKNLTLSSRELAPGINWKCLMSFDVVHASLYPRARSAKVPSSPPCASKVV